MHLDMQRRIVRSVVIIVGIAGVAGAGLIAQSARGVGRDFTQAEPRGQFFRMPDLGGGRLGVSVRDVTASDVGPARLPSQAGAWITDVQADSPAAQADLRTGDVVVQFDGERVRSSRQLSRLVAETPAESTVSVLVRRDGDEVAVDVGLRPQNARSVDRWRDRLAANMRDFEFPDINVNVRLRPGRLGVRVQNVGDQLATYFGVSGGVLVMRVEDDSAAAAADVRAGDVITAVDGAAVASAGDLQRAVRQASGAVKLDVTRDHQSMTLEITLAAPRDNFTRRGRPI